MNNVMSPSESSPKVFGHLYIVVFSNGTVKAGMSARDVENRVKAHTNTGKAFGISVKSSLSAKIYTNDTKDREMVMHKELSLVAELTAGREWFKFENQTLAATFACTYLEKTEKMSLIERPTEQEIVTKEKCKFDAISDLFNDKKLIQQPSIQEEFLISVGVLLDSKSPNQLVNLAYHIIAYEDFVSAESNALCEVPLFKDAVDRHYVEAFSTNSLAGQEESNSSGCSFDATQSREVILIAAHHPSFFKDALAWS